MKAFEEKEVEKKVMNTREFIETFSKLFLCKKYTKPYPRFTEREVVFLTKLLLHKSNDLILFSFIDFLADNYNSGITVFANGASCRRLLFFKHFLFSKGNATKAAISAGYSAKSAKQQGHRLLRWIQHNQNKPLSGFSR